MAKTLVVYWSGTGNTKRMAELVAEGAGGEVALKSVDQATPDEVAGCERIGLGCPSMGAEVLEEGDMEPFVEALADKVAGKKMVLFGSYDWGDGEWMRNWEDRMKGYGAKLADEGLIVHLTPDAEGEEKCRNLGKRLASF